MLLVIDAGNTHTVVGLYDAGTPAEDPRADGGLKDHWRIATNAERTEDEYALLMQEFLGFHGAEFTEGAITGVAVSSGVPAVATALRRMCGRYLHLEPLVLGPGVKSGMPILYDNPHEVGADRIANAVGAYDLTGDTTVVVDFGTATTFDVITAAGEYLGGAIIPGVEISMEALFQRAALLRRVELVEPRSVVGRNTMESIQSGVLYGYASLIDGMVQRIEDEIGDSTVIATGGLANVIAQHTRSVDRHEPWLTLHGLRRIYEKNVDAS